MGAVSVMNLFVKCRGDYLLVQRRGRQVEQALVKSHAFLEQVPADEVPFPCLKNLLESRAPLAQLLLRCGEHGANVRFECLEASVQAMAMDLM